MPQLNQQPQTRFSFFLFFLYKYTVARVFVKLRSPPCQRLHRAARRDHYSPRQIDVLHANVSCLVMPDQLNQSSNQTQGTLRKDEKEPQTKKARCWGPFSGESSD